MAIMITEVGGPRVHRHTSTQNHQALVKAAEKGFSTPNNAASTTISRLAGLPRSRIDNVLEGCIVPWDINQAIMKAYEDGYVKPFEFNHRSHESTKHLLRPQLGDFVIYMDCSHGSKSCLESPLPLILTSEL